MVQAAVMPRRPMLALVDDEPSILQTLEMLLSMRGWNISAHSSAESLLQALTLDQGQLMFKDQDGVSHRLVAVLVDFNLPGMNGVELVKRLRDQTPRLSVVMMTGAHDELQRAIMPDLKGVVGLHKPFSTRDLEVALQDFGPQGAGVRIAETVVNGAPDHA